MQKLLRYAAAVIAVLAVSAARADRFEFILRHDTHRLDGGKVCFFPGSSGSFARQFLLSKDVRCLPADSLFTIPPGTWNIFAVHDGGFVSTHPDFFTVPPNPQDRVDSTSVSMVPAGLVDITKPRQSLRLGEHLAIYISNETRPESAATVRPIADGESAVWMPTGMPLVPLVIASGTVVGVGDSFTVRSSEVFKLPAIPRDATTATIALQLAVAQPWAERSANRLVGAPPQLVLRTTDGSTVRPVSALRSDGMWVKSLVFFRNVPKGPVSVVVTGGFWQEIEASFTVEAQNAQLFEPPLALVPGGRLMVTWKNDDVPAVYAFRTRTTCDDADQETTDTPASAVRLIRCDPYPPKAATDCAVVASATIEDTVTGVATLDGLAPGEYIVELQHGPVRRETITRIEDFETAEANITLRRTALHGRVTKQGKPLPAVITFGNVGTGVSDASGEYVAELKEPFQNAHVLVHPCDGSAPLQFLAAFPQDPTAPFDIDLPNNRVNVSVIDGTTGKPLSEARITYGVAATEDTVGVAYYDETHSDVEGKAVLPNVGMGGTLEICADKTGHVRRCAPRFTLKADEEKDVQIQLTSILARTGRVVSARPIEGGRMYFVVNPGIALASARVAPDGTFTYEWGDNRPDVYLVLLSQNLPLVALPYAAPPTGEQLTIATPSVSRQISITKRSGQRAVPFTFVIDGRAIPRFVLDQHQLFRNRESRLLPGSPLIIPDVSPGQLEVIVGPEQVPPDFRSSGPYSDVFNTPGFAEALLRLAVPSSGVLTIP